MRAVDTNILARADPGRRSGATELRPQPVRTREHLCSDHGLARTGVGSAERRRHAQRDVIDRSSRSAGAERRPGGHAQVAEHVTGSNGRGLCRRAASRPLAVTARFLLRSIRPSLQPIRTPSPSSSLRPNDRSLPAASARSRPARAHHPCRPSRCLWLAGSRRSRRASAPRSPRTELTGKAGNRADPARRRGRRLVDAAGVRRGRRRRPGASPRSANAARGHLSPRRAANPAPRCSAGCSRSTASTATARTTSRTGPRVAADRRTGADRRDRPRWPPRPSMVRDLVNTPAADMGPAELEAEAAAARQDARRDAHRHQGRRARTRAIR